MTDCPNADGSSERITQFAEQPPMCIDTTKNYTATMETSMGDMVIHLDVVNAPVTVNNFVFLSRYHYYDGLIFHRIINGFMCQGGCPEGSGRGGPGYRFEDELPAPGRYEIGSIAITVPFPVINFEATAEKVPTFAPMSIKVESDLQFNFIHLRIPISKSLFK